MKAKHKVILAAVLSVICVAAVMGTVLLGGDTPETSTTASTDSTVGTQQTDTTVSGTLTQAASTTKKPVPSAQIGSTSGTTQNKQDNGKPGTTAKPSTTEKPVSAHKPTSGDKATTEKKPVTSQQESSSKPTTTKIPTASTEGILPALTSENYISPCEVSINGGFAYIADTTGAKVYKLNLSYNSIEKTYETKKQVNSVKAIGTKVYILQGQLAGEVVITDPSFDNRVTVEAEHTPNDIVVSGNKAYVANRFSNSISVIDLTANKVIKTIKVGREPMALALVGNEVFAASHLPEDEATSSLVSADVYVINTVTDKVTSSIPMINGTGSVKDIAVSPDGKKLYLSCIISRYAYPTTQLDRGWINTNAVAVIDTLKKTNDVTVLIDEVDLGASNPWGIDITRDGKKLVVSASGTHEAIVIDVTEMNKRIDAVINGNGRVKKVADIVDYLPFLKGARTRIKLGGNGPRGVAINGNKAYITEYFSGDLAIVDLKKNTVKTVPLGNQPENDAVREGNILFYDATACYQQWQSCASCHPDARTDGFNWDNMNDGLGNPKSTKSMLYAHRTPPTMVTGIRPSAEIAVRAGMKYIQFNNLDEDSMASIDEYLKSLQPEQSPYLNRNGTLTEAAVRGGQIFEDAGCAKCHTAPLYTDLKTHKVSLHDKTDGWENRNMDTPTLVEVWRTGPYHYNGMFDTMYSSMLYDAPALTEAEKRDLAEYVLSIGAENEIYGIEQIFATDTDGKTVLYSNIKPGATLNSFTVRKQWATTAIAGVTVTLCDSKGRVIDTFKITLGDMKVNSAANVKLSMKIPESLKTGGYINFSIRDVKTGKLLATDIRYVYN